MKVKFPEPVSPVVLYELYREAQNYKREELSSILEKIEKGFDYACEELMSGKYSSANYTVDIMSKRRIDASRLENIKCLGDIYGGGFIIEPERDFSNVKYFQLEYRRAFEKIIGLGNLDFLIGIDVEISGFRDTITTEIDALDPPQR